MSKEDETFDGKWYEYPIMRNALISGLLTVSAYGLAHLGLISFYVETSIFIIAI